MIANVGTFDRLFRIILGLALIMGPLMDLPDIWSNPVYFYTSIGVGFILVVTALLRFCPLYGMLGVSTCKM